MNNEKITGVVRYVRVVQMGPNFAVITHHPRTTDIGGSTFGMRPTYEAASADADELVARCERFDHRGVRLPDVLDAEET